MQGAHAVGVSELVRDGAAPGFQPRFGQFCTGQFSTGTDQDGGWKPGSLMAAVNASRGQKAGAPDASSAARDAKDIKDTAEPGGGPGDMIEKVRADAFAQGFDEGMRLATEAATADDAAISHLADSLALLAPATSGALPALLSAAVLRLVEQIVGKAPVDTDVLKQRVEAVAAFIEEEQARKSLHLHPDDIALLTGHELGVELTEDPAMTRGSVRLDSGEGWIEDGPDVQLSRLKAMLDVMEEGAP